jgi:hypothetical protein
MGISKISYFLEISLDNLFLRSLEVLNISNLKTVSNSELSALKQSFDLLIDELLFLLLPESIKVRPDIRIKDLKVEQPRVNSRNYEISLGSPISELNLSTRSYNALMRAGISNVAKLLAIGREELLDLRNFGNNSLIEVEDVQRKLRNQGLMFFDESVGLGGDVNLNRQWLRRTLTHEIQSILFKKTGTSSLKVPESLRRRFSESLGPTVISSPLSRTVTVKEILEKAVEALNRSDYYLVLNLILDFLVDLQKMINDYEDLDQNRNLLESDWESFQRYENLYYFDLVNLFQFDEATFTLLDIKYTSQEAFQGTRTIHELSRLLNSTLITDLPPWKVLSNVRFFYEKYMKKSYMH